MKSLPGFWVWAFPGLLIVGGCKTVPGAGEKAPSFKATLDSGKTASFEELMGEKGLVLYFYPKDETPGCITQACTFQDLLVDFQDKGYKVVGVSVDTGISHQAFKSKHKITFDLISDPQGTIATLFNVPTEENPFGIVGFRRTTFVITRDGIIQKRFTERDPKEQVNQAFHWISEPF